MKWSQAAEEAFQTLINRCTNAPILAYADFSLPFELHIDASDIGLGAVLYQTQEGKKRGIAYASRTLSQSEARYPAHKLEFLALKWALTDQFYEYLYGNSFAVYTDNNPLTYILTTCQAGCLWTEIGECHSTHELHSSLQAREDQYRCRCPL